MMGSLNTFRSSVRQWLLILLVAGALPASAQVVDFRYDEDFEEGALPPSNGAWAYSNENASTASDWAPDGAAARNGAWGVRATVSHSSEFNRSLIANFDVSNISGYSQSAVKSLGFWYKISSLDAVNDREMRVLGFRDLAVSGGIDLLRDDPTTFVLGDEDYFVIADWFSIQSDTEWTEFLVTDTNILAEFDAQADAWVLIDVKRLSGATSRTIDIDDFHIEARPDIPNPPIRISPTEGDTVDAIQPWFSWTHNDTALPQERFHLQISTVSNFATIVYEETTVIMDTQNQLTDPLPYPADSILYWRVRTSNVDDMVDPNNIYYSEFSTGDSTFRARLHLPETPTSLAPVDLHDTTARSIRFSWTHTDTDGSAQEQYEIQLSQTPDFSTFLETRVTTTSNAFYDTTLPDAKDTIYWRVRTADQLGFGPYSESLTLFLVFDETPVITSLTLSSDTPARLSSPGTFDVSAAGDTVWFAAYSQVVTFTVNAISNNPDTLTISPGFGMDTRIVAGPPPYVETFPIAVSDALGDTLITITAFDVAGVADSTIILFRPDTTAPTAVALSSPTEDSVTSATPDFSWDSSADSGAGLSHYELQVTNDSSFATLLASETVAFDAVSLTASYPGSLADSIYYWRVLVYDAVGNYDTTTADTRSFMVDFTPPSTPALDTPSSGFVTASSPLFFSWATSADTVSGVFRYNFEISRYADFSVIETSAYVYAPDTGLYGGDTLAGTETYYWRVRAVDTAGNVSESETRWFLIDTAPPLLPTGLSPTGGFETNSLTLIFSWLATTDTHRSVSEYQIQVATDSLFTALVADSSNGLNLDSSMTLGANDTYYWRVIAVDDLGNTVATSATLLLVDTQPPTAPVLDTPLLGDTRYNFSPVTFDWDTSTDSIAGVRRYRLQVDTAGTFIANVVDSYNTTPDTDILLSVDTYYWRVIAEDGAGNLETSTVETFVVRIPTETEPPEPFTLTSPADNTETNEVSITFTWSDAWDSSLPITYQLIVDTDMAAPYVVDSSTTDSWNTVALPANDTYYWRVIARDASNNTTVIGDSILLVDTLPPTSPAIVSPATGETKYSPVSLDWLTSSDSLAGVTRYRLQLDSSGTFAGPMALDSYQFTADTTLALSYDTYYWRVTVYDDAGNTSATSGAEYFVVIAPGETEPPDSFSLTWPAAGAETRATNLTFTWSDAWDSTPPVTYNLIVDTDMASPFVVDSTTTDSWLQVDLPPNETYYWRVIARDAPGGTTVVGDSLLLVDTTPPVPGVLADPLGGESVTSPVYLDWTSGSDSHSGLRRYRVQVDTANDFLAPLALDAFTTATDTIADLDTGTWFWRVILEDDAGNTVALSVESFVVTAPDTLPPVISSVTLSPSSASNSGTTTILVTIEASDSNAVVQVVVNLLPLGGGESTAAIMVTDTYWELTFVTDTSVSGDVYEILATALDPAGNRDSASADLTVTDVSPTLTAISSEPFEGMRIAGEAYPIVAGWSDTYSMVVFEYRGVHDLWTVIDTDVTGPVWSAEWDLTGLADGDYAIRAIAYDLMGNPDPSPDVTWVTKDDTDSTSWGYYDASGNHNLVHRFYSDSAGIALGPLVRLDVPVGALSSESVFIRIVTLDSIPTSAPLPDWLHAPDTPSVVTLEFETSGVWFRRDVFVTLNYDKNGVSNAKALALFHWDEENEIWVREANSTVFDEFDSVSASINHFTLFAALMDTPARPNLSNVVVYPNPFVPHDGNDRTGRPFNAGDPGSGIIFRGLTSEAHILIYDVTGKLVSRADKKDNFEAAQWDVRNDDGRELASGVYIAVITAPNGQKTVKKIMVIK